MSALYDHEANALRRQLLGLVRQTAKQRKVLDADVARGSGVSDATISRAFSGQQPLSLDSVVRLARWAGYEVRLVARGGGPT